MMTQLLRSSGFVAVTRPSRAKANGINLRKNMMASSVIVNVKQSDDLGFEGRVWGDVLAVQQAARG